MRSLLDKYGGEKLAGGLAAWGCKWEHEASLASTHPTEVQEAPEDEKKVK